MSEASWQLVRGGLFGLAAFAIASHLLLLFGLGVPAWVFPCALGAAGLVTFRRGRPSTPGGDHLGGRKTPDLLAGLCLLLLFVVFAGIAYGTVATPDREWDGFVAWTLKARALAAEPTLEQPFFESGLALANAPDYPLLQPLCLASLLSGLGPRGGRILFPLLFAFMIGLVAVAARRHGAARRVAWLLALAVGTTPFFAGQGQGAVDSGYAELLLSLVVGACAAALLLRDDALLASAALLLPMVKPEGLFLGASLLLATLALAERRSHRAATVGLGLGCVLWLPLQGRLASAGGEDPWPWMVAGSLVLLLVSLAAKEVVSRLRLRPLTILLAAGISLSAAVVALASILPSPEVSHSVLGNAYLARLWALPARLDQLPAILLDLAAHVVHLRKFGLLFCLLLALFALAWMRRIPASPSPLIGFWMLASLPLLVLPFLLSPEADLQHHLRSSMSRLFAHWVAAAWLLVGAWLAPLLVQTWPGLADPKTGSSMTT